ncbi:DNA-binding response regulator [Arcanobacterium haemolyticum]|uniref:DNA-binding response regulator MtrA n=1 Tax=Arcanobacterium haemolyticum (strain ATCC 9345 / DSM 20595 / CCM 5947 / CCUG 17215 / LMG 16163 / NBRC 15585 / NCTC 8452 / 11018) TaxID=644284 RepID=D7BKE1_ARCHD|nr:MtrAB system response regulator MtrA [Arcanobacterium haemolyticum]ADH93121.1 two component transcriptional regulator, winged helix family [Arcanobacterium haemolyticum DSM 20595]QCX47181.1 DNA-binding response regulator [Arcanobacterium haemolyticum]SPT75306.1 DNA-binding response regulator mtrA [Arcanobacterium haemolyticum]SQH28122.1 DNA-binding response regulator mtrA [Arcanobacterium haemolyticum]
MRILVVDDDPGISEMVAILLESEGYDVSVCANGSNVVPLFRAEHPDLVLLDVMLPGLDGVSVCRLLREESDVPIIMMSAKTDSLDVIAGLEAGADDYVTKPFENSVLLARVKVRLRRQENESEILKVADLSIDLKAHEVKRGHETVHLTPLEFDLLTVLARKPYQVFSREELLEQVWGYRHSADTRLVNVHIQRLRAKVERDPENPGVVLTVRGVGYRAGAVKE